MTDQELEEHIANMLTLKRIDALEAERDRLRGALEKIAEYLPSFDYAAIGEYGVRTDRPGSPFDRGREQEASHLSGIARAALKGEGE